MVLPRRLPKRDRWRKTDDEFLLLLLPERRAPKTARAGGTVKTRRARERGFAAARIRHRGAGDRQAGKIYPVSHWSIRTKWHPRSEGMNAAIYARKSTEQKGVADDAKSVTRQIAHAKAFALTKGWKTDDRMCLRTTASVGRSSTGVGLASPVWPRLKPKPPFRVPIVSEQKTIGREMSETAYLIIQLVASRGGNLRARAWPVADSEDARSETTVHGAGLCRRRPRGENGRAHEGATR